MTDPRDSGDRDERLESAYRHAAREEPPAYLDRAILGAARRAGAKSRFFAWPSLPAWRVPVAVAAVLVLSVSVVTLVIEEKGGRLSHDAEPDIVHPAPQVRQAPAPMLEQSSEDAPALSAPALVPQRGREDMPPPRARAARPAPSEAATASVEKSDRSPSPQPRRDAPLPELGAAAGSAQSPAAQPGVAADAATPVLRRALPERSTNEMRGGAYAPQAAPAAPAAAAKAAASIPAALLRELEGQPPEKWLERIESARREGNAALAEALRAEFRRRFPDHTGAW